MALEIRALPKNANLDSLFADSPKGERNRNPTEDQESIQCPSYGLGYCAKTFCISKSWWGIRPKDSNGESNLLSIQCSSYFMGLCNTSKINHATFKMADNHLRMVYMHHQAKHDERILPYVDFGKKKGV